MQRGRILTVGAGLSCAVIARTLADNGYAVDVVEERAHVAGNCHTVRDTETGVLVHVHGPHIFHTSDEEAWAYVNQFGRFQPYVTRVKATVAGRVYSLPINLHTINQFFGSALGPEEARKFISAKGDNFSKEIRSFEDQALKFLGRELYESFFKGYPIKQWGHHPSELPASVLKRLPIRFNYDDNYFDHRYQGIPVDGYTKMVERMLDNPLIKVSLGRKVTQSEIKGYDHVFCSAPLDGWFDYSLGRLGYRTLRFEKEVASGDFQGCAVMSYPDETVPFTRITEHKHFTPDEEFDRTIYFREYSDFCGPKDTPYYPIRLVEEKKLLADYVELASSQNGITFVGRLGTYRYLDMDVTVTEALAVADTFMRATDKHARMPTFVHAPLQ